MNISSPFNEANLSSELGLVSFFWNNSELRKQLIAYIFIRCSIIKRKKLRITKLKLYIALYTRDIIAQWRKNKNV